MHLQKCLTFGVHIKSRAVFLNVLPFRTEKAVYCRTGLRRRLRLIVRLSAEAGSVCLKHLVEETEHLPHEARKGSGIMTCARAFFLDCFSADVALVVIVCIRVLLYGSDVRHGLRFVAAVALCGFRAVRRAGGVTVRCEHRKRMSRCRNNRSVVGVAANGTDFSLEAVHGAGSRD